MVQQLLIHYGELSTKGRNKKMFINKLAEQIRMKTKHLELIKIIQNHDFMHLKWTTIPLDTMITIIKDIPGISRFEPVYRVDKALPSIKDEAQRLFSELDIKLGDSFRVVVKRSDKSYPLDTMALQREVGGYIGELFPNLLIEMKQPTHKLVVSIQSDAAYLSLKAYKGLGGLPYASGGKGMLMLSGGIDSPVAGFQMMKRGLALEVVHFASPPYTSPQALEKTKKLTARLAHFGHPIKYHHVAFTEIQEAIKESVHDDVSMTVMRRFMLRIMARLLQENKAQAIVNGESFGQVASQTLDSMSVINEVTHVPILRPLIATDKNDIISIAEEIGTFDISNEPFEDCCTVFAPRSPKTKPRLWTIQEMEAALDIDGLVERAIQQTETEWIDEHYTATMMQEFDSLL